MKNHYIYWKFEKCPSNVSINSFYFYLSIKTSAQIFKKCGSGNFNFLEGKMRDNPAGFSKIYSQRIGNYVSQYPAIAPTKML